MSLGFHTRALGALLLLFACMYLLGLWGRPMFRPDEFRYAEIPREMIATGEYIVPRFNGIRYYEKPALGYHLTALSFKFFGYNRFALRIVPALSVLLTALLLYWLMYRYGFDDLLPFVCSSVYMTMGLVWGIGCFGVLDSQLCCCLTGTLVLFYMACRSSGCWSCCGLLAGAGAFAGCAFLLKGFLAFAIPVSVIVPFLCWEKRWRQLLLYAWLPLGVALLVILPWSVLVYRADPGFWHYFVIVEHLQRFTGSTLDKRPEPFWYYVPMLAGIFPGGFLVLGAIRGWCRSMLKESLFRYFCCWAVIPFLFFSISSCKMGTYILPCFVPMACLIGWGAVQNYRNVPERFIRGMRRFCRCVSVFVLVLFLVFLMTGLFYKSSAWFGICMLVALCWRRMLKQQRQSIRGDYLALLLGCGCLCSAVMHALPYELMGNKMPEADIRACLEETPVSADVRVFAYRTAFAPVAWILQRNDVILTDCTCELEYGIEKYPEESQGRFVLREEDMIKQYAGKGKNVFITFRNLEKDPLIPEFQGCRKVKKGSVVFVWF